MPEEIESIPESNFCLRIISVIEQDEKRRREEFEIRAERRKVLLEMLKRLDVYSREELHMLYTELPKHL